MDDKQRRALENQETTAKELTDIQKPRKVGTKVGLGVIHDDLQQVSKKLDVLNKTASGDAPKQGREQLPVTLGRYKLDPKNAKDAELLAKIEEADRQQNPNPSPGTTDTGTEASATDAGTAAESAESDEQRTERLTRIGETIQGKIEAERGGTLNTTQTGINNKVFENFIEQTKQREDLLKDATEEQLDIFQRLEDTLIELREANSEDSEKLRAQIAELGGELSETADTDAKAKMQELVGQSEQLSKAPTISGSLGQMVRGNFKAGGAGLLDALALKNESAIERRMGSAAPENQRVSGWAPWKRDEKKQEAAGLAGILNKLKGDKPSTQPGWRTSAKAGVMPATSMSGDIRPAAPVMPSTINIENIDSLNVNAKKVNITGRKDDEADAETGSSPLDMLNPNRTQTGGKPTASPKSSRFGGIKNLAKSPMVRGGLVGIAGLGLSYAGDKVKEAGHEKTGAGLDVAGQTAAWAGTGAMIGSVIPGVGTAIGAGLGAAGGAAYGLYKNWDSFTGSKAKPQTDMVQSKSSAVFLADEPVVPGKPLSARQMQVAEMSMTSGNKLSPEIQAAYDLAKASQAKAAPKTQGQQIQQQSQVNAELKQDSNKPVVVPVPTPVPQPAGAQGGASIQLPRGNIRANESAFDRHKMNTATY